MQQTTLTPATVISALLSGFPASNGIDPDSQLGAYLIAVDGIEPQAIANAAKAYMQGRVKRDDSRFAPSCAEFSQRCRDEQSVIEAARRPRLPKQEERPPAPPVSKEKMQLWRQMTNGDSEARQRLKAMGYAV